MKKSIREKRLTALQNHAKGRSGASELAEYFVASVSWAKLKQACEDLDIKC